jgi:hypothetical protein
MDPLTALLRHIKLEPFIGTGTAAPTPADKALTNAPIAAPAAGVSAENNADTAAPDTDAAAPTPGRTASANAQRLAAGVEAALTAESAETQSQTPASTYTRISSDASTLGRLVQNAQTTQQPMPLPAPLNVAASAPPLVAQTLNTSLAGSGLFYEAHLHQWVAGERSLDSVRQEPHNRPGVMSPAGLPALKAADAALAQAAGAAAASSEQNLGPSAATLPEALQPIVREQLDAVDLQRVIWRGEVWPQQHAELEFKHEQATRGDRGEGGEEGSQNWQSILRIELPGLGVVIARVNLDGEGASVSLRAGAGAIASLRAGGDSFRDAMQAAGISLRHLELSAAAPGEAGDD